MDDPFVLLVGLGARTGGVLGIGGLPGYSESHWSLEPDGGLELWGCGTQGPLGEGVLPACSLLQRPCPVNPYISLLSWAFPTEHGWCSASPGQWAALAFAFLSRRATGFCFHLLARHLSVNCSFTCWLPALLSCPWVTQT